MTTKTTNEKKTRTSRKPEKKPDQPIDAKVVPESTTEKPTTNRKPLTAMTPEERLGRAMKLRSRRAKLEPRLDPKNSASPAEVEQAKNAIDDIDQQLKAIAEFDAVTTTKKPKEPETKKEPEPEKKPKHATVAELATAFKKGELSEKEFNDELDLHMKTKKKATTGTRTRTPGADTDQFGSRPGTVSYAMNAALFDESGALRRVKTIAALSGASEARVRGHIRWLKNKGHKIG